jgi:anti-sigma28 factor (negative regulator of flagellin synthesis)
MRIYDLNLTGTSAGETGRTQETQRPDQADSSRAARAADRSSDRVEFSTALGKLSRAIAAQESSRASRVQALAAQYQSGRYRPDALGTSKGMVAEALAMGGD